MRFSKLAFAFASVATLYAELATAQSDETCIAYMEADAAYEAAEKEAKAAGAAACETAIAPYVSACNAARIKQSACNDAWDKFTEAEDRRFSICSNYKSGRDGSCANATRASDAARELHTSVCEEIRAACGDGAEIAKRDACWSASSSAQETILEPAGEEWGRAYGLAYLGPTSDNPSVFEKLVLADRERCRQRFE